MIPDTIKRSISRKFMLAVLATTFIALLVSALAMLTLNVQNFRTAWVEELTAQADLMSRVSTPALEFNDPKVAAENLAQMQVHPAIAGSALYGPDGKLFARFARDDESAAVIPAAASADGVTVRGDRITLFKHIVHDGDTIGSIYLLAEYPLISRVEHYSAILTIVMAGSLLLAALLSAWLQASVTRPITALTSAVHQVIRRRDFSTRVPKTTQDEVASLVDAFNSMLAEVGEHARALETSNQALQHEMQERRGVEEALRQLNNTLEERIAARTSELERAHEQLRQSQKLEAIGQLTGGIAHDFNNVLQVISGNLQLLKMSLGDNPAAQRRVETAAFATERGAKLSSQLLAFARRQPLQPAVTNLGKILRGMDDLLRRALGESIRIETVVAGGLWNTLIDPNQIENVILNLAINARDAMKGNGKLTLELGNAILDDQYAQSEDDVVAGQYVMLAVSDTGSGMTPDVMARAFEPFFTTKPEGAGTGLGLSMVYGFIKQSQGHIKIYSEVGHGTTIKIYLPRSFQAEAEQRTTLAGPVAGGDETILVVEDDQTVQATVVDMLSALGYRILKANDAESALALLQSGSPVDLLFTDVVMPGPVRSPELARRARELLPDIEVLFTSGYTQNAIVHGGRLDPGVQLISKPYRREELARKIRQMLSNRKPAARRAEAAAPAATAPDRPAEAARPAAQKSILVVEDNDDARQMMCDLLQLLGHQVQGAASAEEALALLPDARFDILLTEVGLPKMSGTELAAQAVRQAPGIRVVFSSGYGDIESASLGFQSVSLSKPYTVEKLQEVLKQVDVA